MTQKGDAQTGLRFDINIDHEGLKTPYLDRCRAFISAIGEAIDVEGVRQVINLLNGCLRWFENICIQVDLPFCQRRIYRQKISRFYQVCFADEDWRM